MLTNKMYTVVQFSSIYYNILFCNSRGKRITFFILIQIHIDLLFYNVFTKKIKATHCLLQQVGKFRKEMKTSLLRLPWLLRTA